MTDIESGVARWHFSSFLELSPHDAANLAARASWM
jgi:hypothetical protein